MWPPFHSHIKDYVDILRIIKDKVKGKAKELKNRSTTPGFCSNWSKNPESLKDIDVRSSWTVVWKPNESYLYFHGAIESFLTSGDFLYRHSSYLFNDQCNWAIVFWMGLSSIEKRMLRT